MKNPNLACDIFKILLAAHVRDMECEGLKAPDKYDINPLITASFRISDQLLDRVDADEEWQAIQKKGQERQMKMQQQQAAPSKPVPAPKAVAKPEPEKA